MNNINLVENLLKENAFWQINKHLAKQIGLLESVLLIDLLTKQKYHRDNGNLKNDMFFATIESIENDTTLSRTIQDRLINKLKKLELISVKLMGIPAKRYFKVNYDKIVEVLQTTNDKTSNQVCINSTNYNEEIPQRNYKNKDIKNKDKNTNNIYSSFAEFWELYPKKTAKKTAEQKFNKLSKEIQQKIIKVLPKFIETKQWKDGYIPNPTTFLNQERYNDDLTAYKEPIKEPKFPRVEKIFKIEYVEPEHSEAYKKQLEIIRKYTAFFIFGDEVSALEILKSLHKYLPKDRYEEAMIKWNYEVYEYKDKSKFANMIPVFNEFLKANYAE